MYRNLFVVASLALASIGAAQVTEAERDEFRRVVREAIMFAVQPDCQAEVGALVDGVLLKDEAIFRTRYGLKIQEQTLRAEVSQGVLFSLDFNVHGVTRPERAIQLGSFLDVPASLVNTLIGGYWQARASRVTYDPGISAIVEVQRGGVPYGDSVVSMLFDDWTGALVRYQGAAFWPRIARGDGFTASKEELSQLEEIALDVYRRANPLDTARIVRSELDYRIPNFSAYSHELTEEHRRIAGERQAIPVYLVQISGRRNGIYATQFVFVDAMLRLPMAVRESTFELSDMQEALDAIDLLLPDLVDLHLLDGTELALSKTFRVLDLSKDANVVVQSASGGLLRLYLDRKEMLLWCQPYLTSEKLIFTATAENWAAIERDARRPSAPFPSK